MIKGEKYTCGSVNACLKEFSKNKSLKYSSLEERDLFQRAVKQFNKNLKSELNKMDSYNVLNFMQNLAYWIEDHDEDFSIQKHSENNSCDIGCVYFVDFGIGFQDELTNCHPGLCIGLMGNKIAVVPMRSAEDNNGNIHKAFKDSYHPKYNKNGDKRYYQALQKEGFEKDAILMVADTRFVSIGKLKPHNDSDVVRLPIGTFREIQETVLLRMMPELAGHYHTLKGIQEDLKEEYKRETLNRINKNFEKQQSQEVTDTDQP